MELFIKDWSLSRKLRLPAISRLQKIHNMEIALQVLKNRGVDLKDEYGNLIILLLSESIGNVLVLLSWYFYLFIFATFLDTAHWLHLSLQFEHMPFVL